MGERKMKYIEIIPRHIAKLRSENKNLKIEIEELPEDSLSQLSLRLREAANNFVIEFLKSIPGVKQEEKK